MADDPRIQAVRSLVETVRRLQPADPDTGDRDVSWLALLEALDGDSENRPPATQTCRACGCTDEDRRACIAHTGQACHWVEADLCSACLPRNVEAAGLIGALAASRMLGVSAVTVRNMACDGRLPHTTMPGTGFRRFRVADVAALAATSGLSLAGPGDNPQKTRHPSTKGVAR